MKILIFFLCLISTSFADAVREVHASPDGTSATRYVTDNEGWNYTLPVIFEDLAPQLQAGWQQAMQTLAGLAPEGATVTQIIIEPIRNGKVTDTEEQEIDGETVEIPIAWEDDYRVIVTYTREERVRTEAWNVSEPSRQFLKMMWAIFES